MKKQTHEQVQKYCGNCYYHNVFDFPKQSFCSLLFQRREDPIVPTLSVCEHWKQDYQKCNCVREALKGAEESKKPM